MQAVAGGDLLPADASLSALVAAADPALPTEAPLAACAAAVDGITMLLSLPLSGIAATASAGLLEAAGLLLEAPLFLAVALLCGLEVDWDGPVFADCVAALLEAPF